MKLGDIKVEALKIMFVDYTDDIDIDSLSSLKDDENFGKMINNMPGAINRCYARLEEKGIVPLKKVTLTNTSGTVSNGRNKI